VVKVLWRHPEAEHEADGLSAWDGKGNSAVARRVRGRRRNDGSASGERCRPGTGLGVLPEPGQNVVVAQLLRRMWIDPPAGHEFRRLASMCEFWAQEFVRKTAKALPTGLDTGLAPEGLALFRALPSCGAREVLLCTDLHAGNVLAAEQEPWLPAGAPRHPNPDTNVLVSATTRIKENAAQR